MVQNNELTNNVDKLEASVKELEQVEEELAKIANSREGVDRLIHVVEETKRINEKMKVRKMNLNCFANNVLCDLLSLTSP